MKDIDTDEVKILSDIAKSKNDKCISFFIAASTENLNCYISVSKNIISSYNAKKLSMMINDKFSGKGGGSDTFATSILSISKIESVKEYIKELV